MSGPGSAITYVRQVQQKREATGNFLIGPIFTTFVILGAMMWAVSSFS
jgi:hypothetical protein